MVPVVCEAQSFSVLNIPFGVQMQRYVGTPHKCKAAPSAQQTAVITGHSTPVVIVPTTATSCNCPPITVQTARGGSRIRDNLCGQTSIDFGEKRVTSAIFLNMSKAFDGLLFKQTALNFP
jgi:hypothetical protein